MLLKDKPAADAVRALTALARKTATPAVRRAMEERLRHVRRTRGVGSLAAEIREIGRRCAALPDLDTRPPEAILGYDGHGLPS